MTDLKIPQSRTPAPSRSRAELLVAAIIAALVVSAGLLLLDRPGEVEQTELAAPPETPVDLAYQIVEARNAFDADALAELLGSAEYGFLGGPVDIAGFASWAEAYDGRLVDPTCEQATDSQVVCTYTFSSRLTRHVGLEGEVDGTLYLFFSSGTLTSATESMQTSRYSAAFEPFFDWVNLNHNEAVETMWDTSFGTRPRLTEESIRLFDEMLTEYTGTG